MEKLEKIKNVTKELANVENVNMFCVSKRFRNIFDFSGLRWPPIPGAQGGVGVEKDTKNQNLNYRGKVNLKPFEFNINIKNEKLKTNQIIESYYFFLELFRIV